MTARSLYEAVLIELNKENAPNILLEQFNYFANKAINNYINKRYNIYDISQQTTDDLRVLKSNATLLPKKVDDYIGLTMAGSDAMATYEVIMPSDYLHILNCICVYKVNKTYKCYNKGDYWRAPATRLTADMYSQVLDNFWNKPTYKKPYYYIHNVNTVNDNYITNEGEDPKINYATTPTNPYFVFEDTENLNLNSDEITEIDNQILLYETTISNQQASKLLLSTVIVNDQDYYIGNYILSLSNGFNIIEVFVTNNDVEYKYIILDIKRELPCFTFKKYNTASPNPSTPSIETCNEGTPVDDNNDVNIARSVRSRVYELIDLDKLITDTEDKINLLRENKNLKELLNNATSKKGRFKGTDSSRELDFIGEDLDGKPNDYGYGQDGNGISIAQGTGLPKYIKIGDAYVSNVERGLALRYGNTSEVRLEIRYGR